MTLTPMGEKTLVGLNAPNSPAYVALISANVRLSFRKPVPGVVKTAPDLTFVLKNDAGKSSLLLNGLAPAPSHEISRRPAGCSPAVPPLEGPPSRVRNSSTRAAMSPVAESVVGTSAGSMGTGSDPELLSHAAPAARLSPSAIVRANERCMWSLLVRVGRECSCALER